jgi:hypothetical protein
VIDSESQAAEPVISKRQAFLAGEGRKVTAVNAVLTANSIVVHHQRFSEGMGGAAGGPLGFGVARRLQKRSDEKHGPLLEVPLSAIRRISKYKRDGIELALEDGRTVGLIGVWKHWTEPLRDALIVHHHRSVAPDGADAWNIA